MDIAVLGVREHGRTIAQLCARSGNSVRLWADDATAVMDAVDRIEQQLADSHHSGESEEGANRIEGTTGLEAAVSVSDVVIETATADVGELQRQFAAIEQHVADDAIIFTAHPELSVTAATAGMRRPERALGLQCVTTDSEPLVELVVTEHYSKEVSDSIEQFVTAIGATAVYIRDTPGLASTRLTLAVEVEAMWLVADGVASVTAVDTLYERIYTQPVGPLERADRIGLAKRQAELQRLTETIGDRYEPPPLLDALVEAGYTGQDAGEGFYQWDGDEPTGEGIEGPHFEYQDESRKSN